MGGKGWWQREAPSRGSERRCAPARVCIQSSMTIPVCACARAHCVCTCVPAPARACLCARARLVLCACACTWRSCACAGRHFLQPRARVAVPVGKCDCPQSEMAALLENDPGGASLEAVPTAAARWRARIIDGSDRTSGFLRPFPRRPRGPGVSLALGLKQTPLTISAAQVEAGES